MGDGGGFVLKGGREGGGGGRGGGRAWEEGCVNSKDLGAVGTVWGHGKILECIT